jgi:ABC transporter substrate binding protein
LAQEAYEPDHPVCIDFAYRQSSNPWRCGALKHLLPATFGGREYVEAGGFMTYSGDLNDLVRRAAAYIDKILKGAKPADLPVEQASKYELVTTSRPLRRSASKCRRCCSAAPTR